MAIVRRLRDLVAVHGGDLLAGVHGAATAAADERTRIARELHDVVAHSVGLMLVQAGAARMQLARDPEQALASVAVVARATATTLGELDRLLDLAGGQDRVRRGLGDLVDLVTGMRETGLEVRLTVVGTPRPLAGGLALACHRILQEALTNARRHAGPVVTDVEVTYEPDQLRLRVVNELPRPVGATIPDAGRSNLRDDGFGHGLLGMRERVLLHGGQLDVAADRRRFAVDARVPAPSPTATPRRPAPAERELHGRRAAVRARERRLIARDLRPLIADGLRDIHAHATDTLDLLDAGDLAAAEQVLLRAEDAGRTTLAHLRRVLGLLRPDISDDPMRPRHLSGAAGGVRP